MHRVSLNNRHINDCITCALQFIMLIETLKILGLKINFFQNHDFFMILHHQSLNTNLSLFNMLYLFNLYFKVTSIITLAGYHTLSSDFTYWNDD